MVDHGPRFKKTFKDVEMDILGDIRLIEELTIEFVRNADGTYSRTMSFQEHARIADEIHRQLRAKRRVYSERE
jgi:hypothetical protein